MGPGVEVSKYMTYPIDVRRPAEGSVDGQVFCGVCKTHIRVTVHSAAATRELRRRWLLLGIGGLALLAVAVVSYVLGDHRPVVGIVGTVGLFTAIGGLSTWGDEDGVRLGRGGPSKGHGPHKIGVIRPPVPERKPRSVTPRPTLRPPIPVACVVVFIGLMAVALLADAISRVIVGAGPVSASPAVLGTLFSSLTAFITWIGARWSALAVGSIFILIGISHRDAPVWGPAYMVVAVLWAISIVLLFVPKSSRAWYRRG